MVLSKTRISKTLIRLRGCAGWSAHLLFANLRRQVFSRRGPNYSEFLKFVYFKKWELLKLLMVRCWFRWLIFYLDLSEVGAPLIGLSPPVKYFTDCSKAVLLLWIFYVFFCLVFAMPLCAFVYCALWSPAGTGWPLGSRLWCLTVSLSLSHWYLGSGLVLDCIDSWSLHPYYLYIKLGKERQCHVTKQSVHSFPVSSCELVTFPLVSWVRCGTWLYRFLIFAPLLTLTSSAYW